MLRLETILFPRIEVERTIYAVGHEWLDLTSEVTGRRRYWMNELRVTRLDMSALSRRAHGVKPCRRTVAASSVAFSHL